MTSTSKPFAATLSAGAELSFMSTLCQELPELKGVSSERLKAALNKAMASAISENGASLLSVVKTEYSLTDRDIHVSVPLHCAEKGTTRELPTPRDFDVRFQVQTSLKHHTSVEQCLRIDLHSLKSTIGIPLFELDTCMDYVASAVKTGEGLHQFEVLSLMKVVCGLKVLQAEASLVGMSNFEDLDVYEGPAMENFFDSAMPHMEAVSYLRQLGRKLEEQCEEQFPEVDKCAYSVALYQLACLLEMFPDYLQECYDLLKAGA